MSFVLQANWRKKQERWAPDNRCKFWGSPQCKIFSAVLELSGCWSLLLFLCGPVMNWQLVQAWRLWQRLQQTPDTASAAGSGSRKEMDGRMENIYCSAVPARLKVSLWNWTLDSQVPVTHSLSQLCVRVKRSFLFAHGHFFTFSNPGANHVTACLDPFLFHILPALLFFWGCVWFHLAVVQKVQHLQSCMVSHSVWQVEALEAIVVCWQGQLGSLGLLFSSELPYWDIFRAEITRPLFTTCIYLEQRGNTSDFTCWCAIFDLPSCPHLMGALT